MSYPPGSYGYPPGPPGPLTPPVPPPPTSSKAITSLVLGIVALFFCGFLLGIPAIIVGMSARKEIRQSDGAVSGDGLAIGGIVTGLLGTLWSLVVGVILVSLLAFGSEVADQYGEACDNARDGQRGDTFFGETIGPEDCP